MKRTNFLMVGLLPLLTSCALNDEGEIEFTWLFWAIIAFFVIMIPVIGISSKKKEEENRKRRSIVRSKIRDLKPSAEVYIRDLKEWFLVFDDKKEIMYHSEQGRETIIPFNKIMSVEFIENNTIITSKSLGRVVSGALIGDLVAGGAGMIVGGLSGGSKQKKSVSRVAVQIKLRDYSKPVLDIVTFDAQRDARTKEIKPDNKIYGEFYKKAVDEAIKITNLIGIIIDKEDNEKKTGISSPSESGIVAEIQNIVSMKEKGLITDEEFIELKKRVMNRK